MNVQSKIFLKIIPACALRYANPYRPGSRMNDNCPNLSRRTFRFTFIHTLPCVQEVLYNIQTLSGYRPLNTDQSTFKRHSVECKISLV